jgi:hypothetical protein
LFQREYEEFKIRINALVAKAQKVPEEGWTMADGTAWPGNNPRDHPGMIQVPLHQYVSFLKIMLIYAEPYELSLLFGNSGVLGTQWWP